MRKLRKKTVRRLNIFLMAYAGVQNMTSFALSRQGACLAWSQGISDSNIW